MRKRLSWELRARRDQFSIDAGRAKGRADPEWYLDCPTLLLGEELYLIAFWSLDTERSIGGHAVGRIPWSKAREYANEILKWHGAMFEMFWRIISELDAGFLEWMKNEHDRHVRMNRPRKTTSTSGGRSMSSRTYSRDITPPAS